MNEINNICIDFGTSNTTISYFNGGENIKQIYDNESGEALIPSYIYFDEDIFKNKKNVDELEPFTDYLIGNQAKNISSKENNLLFYEFKRFLGISKKNENLYKKFLERYNLNYELKSDIIYFIIEHHEHKLKFSIIDLLRLYFIGIYKVIKSVLNILGEINVIITCPAYFNDLQRSQLKIAAEKSGLKIYKIFNEPTAAVIYYIHNRNNNNIQNKFNKISEKIIESGDNLYIVFDVGGGTIDTTVVRFMNDENICEVIDTDGDNSLGGIDIDNLLIDALYLKYKIDPKNKKWKLKLKKISEQIKICLSFKNRHEILLEDIPVIKNFNNLDNNKIEIEIIEELKISFSKNEFENLIEDLVNKMLLPFKRTFEKYQTNNIILIGGPNKIPLILNKIKSITDNKAILMKDNNNPDIYKTIVCQGGSFLYKYIKSNNLCVLDIVPMNIGIYDGNNEMVIMIKKNSKIPTSINKTFTTNYDCQRIINVEIYEGNDDINKNTIIGSYKIMGIPPQPKGTILIKLSFTINTNGILNVVIVGKEGINIDTGRGNKFKIDDQIKIIPESIGNELLKKILMHKKK